MLMGHQGSRFYESAEVRKAIETATAFVAGELTYEKLAQVRYVFQDAANLDEPDPVYISDTELCARLADALLYWIGTSTQSQEAVAMGYELQKIAAEAVCRELSEKSFGLPIMLVAKKEAEEKFRGWFNFELKRI